MLIFFKHTQNLLLWIALSALLLLIAYYTNSFILNDTLYYNSYGEKISLERIEKFLTRQNEYRWAGYTLLPVVIVLKILLITICLYIGLFFAETTAKFNKIIQIVLLSEFVFVFAGLIRIIWLDFFFEAERLEDIQQFAPLSLYSLLNINSIPAYLAYPLQLINLFEIGYILVLAFLLSKLIEENFKRSLGYVLSGYGVGLLLWCVVVVFLQLQLS